MEQVFSYDEQTPESWRDFIAKLRGGELVAIDESMFDYWLGVLPPVWMNKIVTDVPAHQGAPIPVDFAFAEGADYIVYFWHRNGQNYCQQSRRRHCG